MNNLGNGYIPPNDYGLEISIVSQCIVHNDSFVLALNLIKHDDFYNEKFRIIFNSMTRIHIAGFNIDILSLIMNLKENLELEKIGGEYFLIEVSSKVSGIGSIENFCYQLKDFSIKRKCIEYACIMIKESLKPNVKGKDIISHVLNETEKIYQTAHAIQQKSMSENIIEVIDSIGDGEGEGLVGLDTGFREFNNRTSGLTGPDLIVIGAGPGEGKSTFALNIAKHVAETQGGVLFFALEMSSIQLVRRMLAQELSVSVSSLKKGFYYDTQNEKTKFDKAKLKSEIKNRKIYNSNMHIFDKEIESIDDIISISKAEIGRKNIKLIVIDYLQLVPCGNAKVISRNEQIGIVTRKLKMLAIKTNLPVIVLSQINRLRSRSTYVLQDLKESGSIEQDADIVCFIWRPKEHGHESYNFEGYDLDTKEDDCFIKIAKFRDAEAKEIHMKFNGAASRFEDLPELETHFTEPINKKFAPKSSESPPVNITPIEKQDNELPF